MSDQQAVIPLPMNLPAAKGAVPSQRSTNRSPALPKDVQDLLGTFLSSMDEIQSMRSAIRSISSASQNIAQLADNSNDLNEHTDCSKHSSVTLLQKAHISLATTSDVGRMIFCSKLYTNQKYLSTLKAYRAAQPPPVALCRKMKAVSDKMEHVSTDIQDICRCLENGNKDVQTPLQPASIANPSMYADWTLEDINALLTDIDNQFVLVQRMVSFLQGEVRGLEASADNGSEDEDEEQEGGLEVSFQDLRVGESEGVEESYLPPTPKEKSAPTAAASLRASKSQVTSPVPQRGFAARSPGGRTPIRRKPSVSAWDKLRCAVKNSKRPTYSLELYEQLLDEQELAAAGATEAAGQDSYEVFRQCGYAYRQLRARDASVPNIPTLAHQLLSQYSQGALLSRSPLTSPQKMARDFSSEAASDRNHRDKKVIVDVVPGFAGKNYVSPLKGVIAHIDKYAERQPKTPPPPQPAAPSLFPAGGMFPQGATSSASMAGAAGGPGAHMTGRTRSGSGDAFDGTTLVPRRSRGESRQLDEGRAGEALPPRLRSGSHLLSPSVTSPAPAALPARSDAPLLKKSPKSTFLAGAGESTLPPSLASPVFSLASGSAATTTGAPAAASAGVADEAAELARQIREVYAAYMPDKLADVAKLLLKYAGREREMLDKLIKKYGPVPSAAGAAGAEGGPASTPPRKPSVSGPSSSPAATKTKATEPSGGDTLGGFGGFGAALTADLGDAPSKSASLFGGPASGTGGLTSLFGGKPAGASAATPAQPSAATLGGATPASSLFGSKISATATPSVAATPAPASSIGSLFGSKPATAASATATSAVDSLEAALQRVQAIYSQHNPSKLSEIPALMEKYKGQEQQLVAKLEKKYGVTPSAAPATSLGGASIFGSPPAAGAAPGGSTGSVFGSTGFGSGGGSTLFGKPAASSAATAGSGATVPSPFGGATGASSVPSPFGAAASSVPSPFSIAKSPTSTGFGSTGGAVSAFGAGAGSSGGIFASAGTNVTSTGFGQQNSAAAAPAATSSGIGSLFGGGSSGKGSAGVGGAASPFATPSSAGATGTGGLFGQPGGAAAGSPFNTGFNTPLGRAAGAGTGSLFQQPGQAAQPAAGGSLFGGGGGGVGGTGIGGTTSPSVFGGASRAPATGNSLFGGGAGTGTSTGFGGSGGGSMFGSGGGASMAGSASVAAGGGGLNSLQAVQQRVHAIYAQYNPGKLSEIPAIMEKYRGQELQLIANLEKKYGIDSSGHGGAHAGNAMGTGAGAGSMFQSAGSGTGGLFGGSQHASGAGGLFGTPNRPTAGSSPFGGAATNTSIGTGFGASTTQQGSSLFGRPTGATGGGNSLFGGGMAPSSQPTGASSSTGGSGGLFGGLSAATAGGSGGFGGAQGGGFGGGGSGFGSTTRLGGGPSTGFGAGSTGFGAAAGGTGGLFGGGSAGNSNSMWGNR